MKIIDNKDFMALPPGAICCEGQQWCFGEWFRKEGNCGDNDYFLTSLDWTQFEHKDSGEMMDAIEAALTTGVSLPLTFGATSRDGCFERGRIFCVLEDADIDALIACLQAGKGIESPRVSP